MATKIFDTRIEGLRGFAAFTVALWHIFYFKFKLDPGYAATGEIFEVNFAHNSVLLFFIISGYVIGLTNRNEFSFPIAGSYLKKRWVRLYPLYFISIISAIIIWPVDNVKTIFSNLLFGQYLFTNTIEANPVLWTLNFEVIYYLLFILLIAINVHLIFWITLSFILAHIILVWNHFPIMISDYATGWFFWLTGLYAAWQLPKSTLPERSNKIFSMLFAFLATSFLEPDLIFYGQLHLLEKFEWHIINIGDFFAFPVCFSLVLHASGRVFRFHKLLDKIILIMMATVCAALIFMHKYESSMVFQAGIIFCIIAIMLQFISFKYDVFAKLTKLGNISYAIYIIHIPVMFALGQITILSGSVYTFIIRAIIFIGLTIWISYLLEKKLQPVIKTFFFAGAKKN
nr:acyltransferase [Bacteroidota bacterium]